MIPLFPYIGVLTAITGTHFIVNVRHQYCHYIVTNNVRFSKKFTNTISPLTSHLQTEVHSMVMNNTIHWGHHCHHLVHIY